MKQVLHVIAARLSLCLSLVVTLVVIVAVSALGNTPGQTAQAADSLPTTATQTSVSAWRAFQHALGQPALIAANADHALANAPWRPIPAFSEDDIDADKFRLGFHLFHEGRLSSADSVACISCHAGPLGGVDGLRLSQGVNRARGHFNSLSLFNAAFNFRQFWDGRSVTLGDQALEPIINEVEMANTLEAVQLMLQNDEQYLGRFSALYPDGVTLNNMVDAMTHYQQINFTRVDSAFMRQLSGEEGELSEQALRGMQRFRDIGCVSCHNGINLGGNSYQQLGAVIPYYDDQRAAGIHDEGIHRRSQRQHDMYVFKVPALHAVAATAPYFHDGSVATLDAAITKMAEHQLGMTLDEQEVSDIAAFLRALLPATQALAVDMSIDADAERTGYHTTGDAGSQAQHPGAEHHTAYLDAIAAIDQAYVRLLAEMQRIDSGELAHFDFLQFQHLELIRYARALHYPPADLDADTKQRLLAQAEKLLTAVNQLEWIIADFLRAQAMIQVFTIHQEDAEHNQLGDVSARLAQFRDISEKAMEQLSASAIVHLSSALRDLYSTGADIKLKD